MVGTPAPPPLPAWLRRLPWAGGAIALGLAALLGYLLAVDESQVVPVTVGMGTLLYAGKEGGIPMGISLGGEPFLVGLTVFLADLGMTFVLFPLVLASLNGAEKGTGFVGRMLRTARRRADRQRPFVDRYGVAGLFVFLLVPFAFNGPLVGAVLGRLAGLSPLQSLATVACAIAATTIAWTALFAYGFSELGLDPRVPALLSICIAGVMVGTSVWAAWKERRDERATAAVAVSP